MDPEENKALVRRSYQQVLTGRGRDLPARLLDPAFVSHVPGRPAAGAGACTAAAGAAHAAFPGLVVTVHDQVAGQDQAVTGGARPEPTPGTSPACLPPAAGSPAPASASTAGGAGG